ncbi:hypothetical protein M0R45_023381 [Rubus argutus]|uniref:TCP domain-containing protein n=1 Tax=Rubus argutus TaxID=59490 RepID=A0AAW1WQ66_RUBAR
MITNSRGKGFQAKQEGQNNNNNNDGNIMSSFNKAASSSTTTSRQWSGFRNPRIVRVSRTFGGKDRHSKGLNRLVLANLARISEQVVLDESKGKSIKANDDHDQQALAQKLFPIGNMPSSIPGLLNNAMAYNNYFHHHNSEPSSLSLSQFGSSHGFPLVPQMDHMMSNNNGLSFSTTSMPMASGSQFFLCPSTATPVSSGFGPYTPYITTTTPVVENSDDDQPALKQTNNHMIQLLSSSSSITSQNFGTNNGPMPSLQYSIGSSLRSFPTLVNPKLHSQNNNGSSSELNKDHTGS